MTCLDTSCFFKADSQDDIYTFKSCPYNYRLITDQSLAFRLCRTCAPFEPFSIGFAEEECLTCEGDTTEWINTSPTDKHYYDLVCETEEEIIDDGIDDEGEGGEEIEVQVSELCGLYGAGSVCDGSTDEATDEEGSG